MRVDYITLATSTNLLIFSKFTAGEESACPLPQGYKSTPIFVETKKRQPVRAGAGQIEVSLKSSLSSCNEFIDCSGRLCSFNILLGQLIHQIEIDE